MLNDIYETLSRMTKTEKAVFLIFSLSILGVVIFLIAIK